jgi:hypothetical protein
MIQSKNVSTDSVEQAQEHDSKWDEAITDAKGELLRLTVQAKRLQQAIKIFQANKRDGVQWPKSKGDTPEKNVQNA